MTIPDSIPFSSVDFGVRGRTEYKGIEDLAESITQIGLIQPIVLEMYWPGNISHVNGTAIANRYLLRAGGRRYTALKHLGTTTLFHASTSVPNQPGFLLANVAADQLTGLLIEIGENHDRDDVDWRDDLRMVVKAYGIFRTQELAKPDADFTRLGMGKLQRQFGAMCKLPAADLKHGLLVHDELVANPEMFADCTHIRAAYTKILRTNAEYVSKLAAEKSFTKTPLKTEATPSPVQGQADPSLEVPVITIPLSQSIHLGNGLDLMRSLADQSVDHIVTDPDYAVSIDLLESNADNANQGVVHTSVDESLADLFAFIKEAFRITKGFCVLWYDLDHHEKLAACAVAAGWRVQRWPLIWEKLDAGSNAAPNHNFTKNIEYAMVLRKPSCTLVQAQRTCVYHCTSRDTVRKFGHPFAKPIELWRWIYSAIAIRGQVVLDPFAGKGSAPCAAIASGLRPLACEINDAHFGDLTLNMQAYYREALGTNINFS